MKSKMVWKICIDIAMTIALLFLMACELVGQATHEWLGVAMFCLFALHHMLNRRWCKSLLKGRYTAPRLLQTILVIFAFVCMLGSMVSGIVLSRHAFAFLGTREGQSWARTVHLLCAYWGFVLMSLHLGTHWAMILSMARKHFGSASPKTAMLLRLLAGAVAVYGAYAFVKREIGSYLFLRSEFVYFNFEEPLVLFFLDYMAIMGLFIFAGYYLMVFLRNMQREGLLF